MLSPFDSMQQSFSNLAGLFFHHASFMDRHYWGAKKSGQNVVSLFLDTLNFGTALPINDPNARIESIKKYLLASGVSDVNIVVRSQTAEDGSQNYPRIDVILSRSEESAERLHQAFRSAAIEHVAEFFYNNRTRNGTVKVKAIEKADELFDRVSDGKAALRAAVIECAAKMIFAKAKNTRRYSRAPHTAADIIMAQFFTVPAERERAEDSALRRSKELMKEANFAVAIL